MSLRHYMNLLESDNAQKIKALKPSNGQSGDYVVINGYVIHRLPTTADFAYSVSKDGRGEKFYTSAAVLDHVGAV